MSHSPLRAAAAAKLQPSRPKDGPFLLVVQLGEMRRCVNMCSYYQRRGFHVVCGDRYGRRPEALQFIPDAILCRVEGRRRESQVRPEFLSLGVFRRVAPMTPLVVWLADAAPSAAELSVAGQAGAVVLHKRGSSHDRVLATLREMIGRHRS